MSSDVAKSAGPTANEIRDERSFYWEHLKHEDTLFSNRVSFFLVGESILVGGVVAFLSRTAQNQQSARIHPGPFCLVGLVISLIWLYANLKHLLTTRKNLKDKLRACSPAWAEIELGRRYWPGVHWVVGTAFPLLFAFVWFYLLYAYADQAGLHVVLTRAARTLIIVGLSLDVAGIIAFIVFELRRATPVGPPDDQVIAPPSAIVPRAKWGTLASLASLLIGFVLQIIGVIVG